MKLLSRPKAKQIQSWRYATSFQKGGHMKRLWNRLVRIILSERQLTTLAALTALPFAPRVRSPGPRPHCARLSRADEPFGIPTLCVSKRRLGFGRLGPRWGVRSVNFAGPGAIRPK